MRKIKNYICKVLLLSAFMGYAQVNEYAGTPNGSYGLTTIEPNLREVVVVAHNRHSGGSFVTSLSAYLNANANQYPTSSTNNNSLPPGVDLSQASLSNSFQTSGTSAAAATSTKTPIPTGELLYQNRLSPADFVRLLRTLATRYNVIKTVPYSYVGTADGIQRIGYLTTITDKYGTTTLYYFSEASGNGDQIRMEGLPAGGKELGDPNPAIGGYNAGGVVFVTLYNGSAQPQDAQILTNPNTGTLLVVRPAIKVQGNNSTTNTNKEKHVPKATDVYAKSTVKDNINKTFAIQLSKNCSTEALSFVGKWIFNNQIDQGKILLKLTQTDLQAAEDLFREGLTTLQNVNLIKALYNTSVFTSYKEAIDKGEIIMTDIFDNIVKEYDNSVPPQLIEKKVTHAVAIVGYDADNKFIFYDPAEGNFQIAKPEFFNQSYLTVIKSTK